MITEQETRQLIGIMSVIYPNMPISEATIMPMIRTYQRIFARYTYEQLSNALEVYASTNLSGFPPQPAHLIDIIESTKENFLDFSEVYDMICQAVSRASVQASKDFNNFPEIVQRLVGSPQILREWGATAYPDRKNLEYSYKTLIQETRQKNRMSQDNLMAIEQNNTFRLEKK